MTQLRSHTSYTTYSLVAHPPLDARIVLEEVDDLVLVRLRLTRHQQTDGKDRIIRQRHTERIEHRQRRPLHHHIGEIQSLLLPHLVAQLDARIRLDHGQAAFAERDLGRREHEERLRLLAGWSDRVEIHQIAPEVHVLLRLGKLLELRVQQRAALVGQAVQRHVGLRLE